MSTRSSTRTRSHTIDVAVLSNVESLILAQATWELGTGSWVAIAKILNKHPLISRPKSFFTAQSSHAMYKNLMEQAGLQYTEAGNGIHSIVNHKLAEIFYRARLEELRELIIAEEAKFKEIVSEIEDIRSGRRDPEIQTHVSGISNLRADPEPKIETSIPEPVPDEIFDGSDLSGVTVTPPSMSQYESVAAEEGVEAGQEESTPNITQKLEEPQLAQVIVTAQKTPPLPPDIPHSPSSLEADPNEGDNSHHLDDKQPDYHPDAAPPHSPGTYELFNPPEDTGKGEEHDESLIDEQEDKKEEEAQKAPEERAGGKEEELAKEREQEEQAKLAQNSEEIRATPPQEAAVEQDVIQLDPQDRPTVSPIKPVVELEIDEGNSSGEEPLQVSRRSTRRRRSTLSPAQPLQTRGKSRRQLAESPATTVKEEPEVELVHEDAKMPEENPHIELDRGVSSPGGDTRRRDGKRRASFLEGIESPRDRKRTREGSEPAEEDEAGPSLHASRTRRRGDRTEERVALKRFQNVIGMLHSQISQHRNGNIFHNPIKNSEAPDYHEIVKRPIDLKTIRMKVKDGIIANSLEYQRDIFLMFANALMYNRPGSDVHTMAEEMMVESEGHILAFRQTEGLVRGAHRT